VGQERLRRAPHEMKKVLVLCEGQTEQTFVSRILGSHLQQFGKPVVLKTKVTRAVQQHKGDVSRYARIRRDVLRLRSCSVENLTGW
jgi:CTP:molybdopterin cytidylyltransferase MocA